MHQAVVPSRLVDEPIHHAGFAEAARRCQQDMAEAELFPNQIDERLASVAVAPSYWRPDEVARHTTIMSHNTAVAQQECCITAGTAWRSPAKMEGAPGVNPFSNITTAISLALDSIRAHKLRSFLTLLGVIVGVASVILVGAAIDGLGVYAENITAKAFGSDSFLVAQIASVGRLSSRQLADKQRRNKRIRPDDVAYLRAATGDSIIYSPYAQHTDDVKGENQVYEGASILGASATLPEFHSLTSTAPSTEPSPVARLYAAPPAVNPVTPGTLLFPNCVAWNGLRGASSRGYSPALALPCPAPPWDCTTNAIIPANEGDAAEVPEMIQYEPFSAIM